MRSTDRWMLTVSMADALALAPAVVPAGCSMGTCQAARRSDPRSARADGSRWAQSAKDINDAFEPGSEGFESSVIQRDALAHQQ